MTSVGAVLRRFSLDEIPQLWNVLRGEMSLVGPRPLPLRDYERLEAWHRKRYLVLPGVTGLWQISGRSNLGFDDLVRLDFYYLENWSIWLDISILAEDHPGRARAAAARTEVQRVLVTGPAGFVGGHLRAELGERVRAVRGRRARRVTRCRAAVRESGPTRSSTSRRESSVAASWEDALERLARERRTARSTCSRRFAARRPRRACSFASTGRGLRQRDAASRLRRTSRSGRSRRTRRARPPPSSPAACLGARRRRRAGVQPRGPGPRRALRRRLLDAPDRPAGGRGRRHPARRRPLGRARPPRRARRLPRLPAAARPLRSGRHLQRRARAGTVDDGARRRAAGRARARAGARRARRGARAPGRHPAAVPATRRSCAPRPAGSPRSRSSRRSPTRSRPRASAGAASHERHARADHRDHRPGRLVPGRAAAGEGLRGLRHDAPRLDREPRADRAT